MTDRLKRETELPKGYQFGDARPEPFSPEGATVMIDGVPHVIGIRSTPLTRMYDHDFGAHLDRNIKSGRFPFTPQGVADCVDDAAARVAYGDWNVIEGDHHPLDEQ